MMGQEGEITISLANDYVAVRGNINILFGEVRCNTIVKRIESGY